MEVLKNYPAYLILGLLPSFVWLLFYLLEDRHPEPKRMVLKVFFWGLLTGPLALFLEFAFCWLCAPTPDWHQFRSLFNRNNPIYLLNIILFAPLIEEYLKYFVVKRRVLKDPAFDEPLDAMLYLIISALGFAAIENFLIIFLPELPLKYALYQTAARFISATLLHTLSSGILGYFLAISLLNIKKKRTYIIFGFLAAAGLHSLYNFLAWLQLTDPGNYFFFGLMIALLAGMAALTTWQFYSLKKKLSVCKIR